MTVKVILCFALKRFFVKYVRCYFISFLFGCELGFVAVGGYLTVWWFHYEIAFFGQN